MKRHPTVRVWPGVPERITMGIVAAIAVLGFPLARQPVAVMPGLVPAMHGALLLGAMVATAQLGQVGAALRDRRVLACCLPFGLLAGAMVVHALAFPGTVGPAVALARNPSASLYATLGWHLLFPLGVVAAVLLPRLPLRWPRSTQATWDCSALAVVVLVPVATVVLGAWALSTFGGVLPVLTEDGREYGSLSGVAGPTVLIADVAALGVPFLVGLDWPLATWLPVSVVASMGDSLLTFEAAQRYTLGWYEGRALAIVAVLAILVGVSRHIRLIGGDLQASREREAAAAHFRHLALHDGLTGMPNWTSFQGRVRDELVRDARSLVLVIVELEGLRELALAMGRDSANAVLRALGSRLRSDGMAEPPARVSDRRIAVLVRGPRDSALTAAREMLRLAREPVEHREVMLTVDAHAGVATGEEGDEPDELFRRAALAAAVAGDELVDVLTYEERLERYPPESFALLAEVPGALRRDEMELWYQPIVDCADGRPRAAEALLRWRHPAHGIVPPGRFLPLLERTATIDALTEWTITRAAGEVARLGGSLAVGVNVPVRALRGELLGRSLRRALAESGVAPERLRIEVTESGVMQDVAAAITVLEDVRGLGVRVSIDDFGSGYSSLAYLARLPVDEVKVDQSIVRRAPGDERAATVVRAATELAHSLGLAVVMEGIEDEAVWRFVRGLGCDLAQGYFFGRPAPYPEFAAGVAAARR